MKLKIILILAVLVCTYCNFNFLNSVATKSIEETKIRINYFYDREYKSLITSCQAKISYQVKTCQINSKASIAGKLRIMNIEEKLSSAELAGHRKGTTEKDGTPGAQPNSLMDSAKNGVESIGNAVKQFRFKSVISKKLKKGRGNGDNQNQNMNQQNNQIQNNNQMPGNNQIPNNNQMQPNNNFNNPNNQQQPNPELQGDQRPDREPGQTPLVDKNTVKPQPPASQNEISGPGQSPRGPFNNSDKNKSEINCESEAERLALGGILDTRYIKGCEVLFEGNPAGGYNVKFTVISRETEVNYLKPVELIIPGNEGLTIDVVQNFVKELKSSCEDAEKNIDAVLGHLESQYCSKRFYPKKYDNCEEMKSDEQRKKCQDLTSNIKESKEEVDRLIIKIQRDREELDNCAKEKLRKENDQTGKDRDMSGDKKQKEALEAKIKALEQDIADKTTKLSKASQNVIDLKKQKDDLTKKLEDTEKDKALADKINDSNEGDRKRKEKHKTAIQAEITETDMAIARLQSEDKKKQKEIEAAHEAAKKAFNENDDKNEKLNRNNSHATDIQAQIADANNDIAKSLATLNNLKNEADNYNNNNQNHNPSQNNEVEKQYAEALKNMLDQCESLKKNLPELIKAKVGQICNDVKDGASTSISEFQRIGELMRFF